METQVGPPPRPMVFTFPYVVPLGDPSSLLPFRDSPGDSGPPPGTAAQKGVKVSPCQESSSLMRLTALCQPQA